MTFSATPQSGSRYECTGPCLHPRSPHPASRRSIYDMLTMRACESLTSSHFFFHSAAFSGLPHA
jgi:hypothetical protein